jgi:hypothetical protein
LCGYIQHPEIKSLGPDGEKCNAETRGLLRGIPIKGGLHHPIGKEISRFEQGQDDFVENIDDVSIRYDGGRVAANESLKRKSKSLDYEKQRWRRARPENDSFRSQWEKSKGLNSCEGRERIAVTTAATNRRPFSG